MVHLSHKEHHEPSTITEKGSSGTRIQKESTPTTTTKSVHPTKSVNATRETPATSHNQTGLEAEIGKEVVLGVVKGVNLIVDGLMTKSLKNDGVPKDAAPKAKAVKPDPPKAAAQKPAQKAAANAAPAPAVLVVVVPTATSLAVAVPVAVAPAAGPPQAYVLPQAGVPQQAYAAPQAYTSPQGYAPAQAYASQGVGARNLPTGGSYMAVAGGEAATMVSPLVVHGRVPQTSPVAVQASAIGNYATGITPYKVSPSTGRHRAVETLSQPMNITTEVDVGVDKAVVDTYTHTEVTLSRGDNVRENADDDNGTDSDDNGDNNNNGDESDENSDN